MAGVTLQPIDGNGLLSSVVSTTATTTAAPTGVTGKIIRVYKLFLVVDGAVTITFQNGSTALTGAMSLAANGSIALDLDGQPWFVCSSGASFNITQSGSAQVSGAVYYTTSSFS